MKDETFQDKLEEEKVLIKYTEYFTLSIVSVEMKTLKGKRRINPLHYLLLNHLKKVIYYCKVILKRNR